jgi:hypothetical protein
LGHRSVCKYLSTRPRAVGASHDGCRSSGCARRREKRAASGERQGQQSETHSDLAQGHGGRRAPLGLEGSARDGRTMPASTAVAQDGALTRFRKQPVQCQSRAMNTAAQLHRAGHASAHEKGVEGVREAAESPRGPRGGSGAHVKRIPRAISSAACTAASSNTAWVLARHSRSRPS